MTRSPSLATSLATCVALIACGSATPAPVGTPTDGQASDPKPAPAVNEDQAQVLAVINAERSSRELPPVEFIDDSRPLATAADLIRRGSPPDVALRTALERVVEAESSQGQGWCLPTETLTDLQLPSVVVEEDELTLGVIVVRPSPGAIVVCYLVIEGQDLQGN
jgi:hypothetical protein